MAETVLGGQSEPGADQFFVLAVWDLIDPGGCKLRNTDRILYEVQLYMNWKNTGQLPAGNLYDMPVDVMFTLFEMHSQLAELEVERPPERDPADQPIL